MLQFHTSQRSIYGTYKYTIDHYFAGLWGASGHNKEYRQNKYKSGMTIFGNIDITPQLKLKQKTKLFQVSCTN